MGRKGRGALCPIGGRSSENVGFETAICIRTIEYSLNIDLIFMKKIIGLGNALVDVLAVMESDKLLSDFGLPKGSMQLVDRTVSDKIVEAIKNQDCAMVTGGSANNTIYGLAKLGVEAGFVGKIGDDRFGRFFEADSLKNGVKTSLIRSENPSGICASLVSPDGERTMATFLGAASEMSAADVKSEMFDGYDYCHVEGYLAFDHEFITAVLKKAKDKGLKVSFDLASYNLVADNLEFMRDLVRNYVDVVFANEEEAKAFTGKEAEAALDEMATMCETVVVKVGAKGSFVKRGSEKVFVKPIGPDHCLDSTGAGDLYASGFLYGQLRGDSIELSGKYGSLLSGQIVQVVGARLGEDVWSQIRTDLNNL